MKFDHVTYVHSKSEMPTGEHWAIIEYSSVWIPGDERSRTNPGHGYPARSEPSLNYMAFSTLEKLEAYLEAHKSMKSEHISILHVKPATVTIKTVIEIK